MAGEQDMGRIGYSTWVQVVKIIGSREEFGHQKGPLDTGVTQSVRASEKLHSARAGLENQGP